MIKVDDVFEFTDGIFGYGMHAKRIQSLSNATLGVIQTGSLAVHAIGAGLAQACELQQKHTIKQVDRLLSNPKLNVWSLFDDWVPYIVADRKEIVVSMDWTDFDDDFQASIVLSLQTRHGHTSPLIWKTVKKSTLKGKRNDYEDEVLNKLHQVLSEGVKVTIVADRGFSDVKLYHFLKSTLGFDYIIRTKANIQVTDLKDVTKVSAEWLTESGRTKSLKDARLTKHNYPVKQFIAVKKKGMKQAWFLATSRDDLSATQVIKYYSQRWSIETTFRDIKDYRFGMGMSHNRTKSAVRRDRLFLISALAIVLLTLLGKAGDDLGYERTIKANTVKTRTFSFFRQGCIYYSLLPGMKEDMALDLMHRFYEYVEQLPTFKKTFGII